VSKARQVIAVAMPNLTPQSNPKRTSLQAVFTAHLCAIGRGKAVLCGGPVRAGAARAFT